MYYLKKYVVEVNEYYIWFYEQNNQAYFGIDKKENIINTCKITKLPKSSYGKYDDIIYIAFANCIYKADIKELYIKPVEYDLYNISFLDNSIIAVRQKQSRFDEYIQILPENDTVSLGILQNENFIR